MREKYMGVNTRCGPWIVLSMTAKLALTGGSHQEQLHKREKEDSCLITSKPHPVSSWGCMGGGGAFLHATRNNTKRASNLQTSRITSLVQAYCVICSPILSLNMEGLNLAKRAFSRFYCTG